jgi:hypothetical protein
VSFGAHAQQLAGQAGLLLGWRPDAFWRSTPDELATAFAALLPTMMDTADPPSAEMVQRLKEIHPDG